MTVSRLGRALALLALILIEASCGDVFRPVAVPVSPPSPDPSSFHYVLVLSQNAPSNPGRISRVDVSGDTAVGEALVGVMPVHAALIANGSRAVIANAGEGTVSAYTISSPTTVNTITLPPNGSSPAVPVFVTTTENSNVYVADSGNGAAAAGRVLVVSTTSNVVTGVIPVGTNPIALAELPNATKVYAVNQGDGTVTSINVANQNINATIPVGTSPVWAIARADNNRVYVLNSGDGTLATIDANSDTLLASPVSIGVGANYMAYDPKFNRIYVNNPVANTVTALNVSSDPPAVLFTTTVPASPLSLAALPDGSRIYVASGACSSGPLSTCAATGGTITSQVTVINTNDGSIKTTVPMSSVPAVAQCSSARFDLFVAAAASSTRVYVANCDAGNTAIIRTVAQSVPGGIQPADSFVLNLPAPVSAYPPSSSGAQPPPQNPVFIVSGP